MAEPVDYPAEERSIAEALTHGSSQQWARLWAAVDVLAGETTFAEWKGGDVVGTTTVDGEERPVHQMPYPVYSPAVEELLDALGELGLSVVFDWMSWPELPRYRRDPEAIAHAPVADAVRLLTAIRRSERFSDGSIEGALESGVMQATVARLRRWHDTER